MCGCFPFNKLKKGFSEGFYRSLRNAYSALALILQMRVSNLSFTGKSLSFSGSPLPFAISVIQKNKKYFSYFLFYQLDCCSSLTECLGLISLLKRGALDTVLVFSSCYYSCCRRQGSISEPSEWKQRASPLHHLSISYCKLGET